MSSHGDIVKYSATMWMLKDNDGKTENKYHEAANNYQKMRYNRLFIFFSLLGALVMLAFQAYLMINLIEDNDSLLFCGDVIRMVETEKEKTILFKDDSVMSFNASWYDFNVKKEEAYWKKVIQGRNKAPAIKKQANKGKQTKKRRLEDVPDDQLPADSSQDNADSSQNNADSANTADSTTESCDYYSEYYDEYIFDDCTYQYLNYTGEDTNTVSKSDEEWAKDVRNYSNANKTLDEIQAEYNSFNQNSEIAQLEFIQNLSESWKTEVINTKLCRAPESSTNVTIDLARADSLADIFDLKFKQAWKDQKDSGKKGKLPKSFSFPKYNVNDVTKNQINDIRKNHQKNTWICPKEWRDQKGKCQLMWNCTIKEWQTFCSGQMTFATTVESTNKPAWYAGLLILGITVTGDLYDHLSVMRQVPFFFKLLLICQCVIAVNIGIINASMTAGQSTPVDILMNSMGLLVLNDMDNIFGQLFQLLYEKSSGSEEEEEKEEEDEEDGDLLADNTKPRDRVFARWLTLWHLFVIIFYGMWFTKIFQFENPETTLRQLILFQPYSPIVFPVILTIWYWICYLKCCAPLRCKCIFRGTMNFDNEVSTEKVEPEDKKKQLNDLENKNEQSTELMMKQKDKEFYPSLDAPNVGTERKED